MFDDFIIKLPKDVPLSNDIKGRAEGYMKISLFGIPYYVPITKEVKKLFKIKRRGRQFIFDSYKKEGRFRKFVRDIITSIYLQVRDTIGSEIHSQLRTQIEEGFGNMFNKILDKKINLGFQKLLPYKKGDKNENQS